MHSRGSPVAASATGKNEKMSINTVTADRGGPARANNS